MNGNQNMVQKPKDEENYIDDEEEDIDEEAEEASTSTSSKGISLFGGSGNDAKQKMISLMDDCVNGNYCWDYYHYINYLVYCLIIY